MRLTLLVILPLAQAVLSQTTNETLWGAYRPNLYFGLRPRFPKSLMTGLMWFGTQDYQSASSMSDNILITALIFSVFLQMFAIHAIKATN